MDKEIAKQALVASVKWSFWFVVKTAATFAAGMALAGLVWLIALTPWWGIMLSIFVFVIGIRFLLEALELEEKKRDELEREERNRKWAESFKTLYKEEEIEKAGS